MTTLGKLVKEIEDKGLTNKFGKAFPYLGWFWREIDEYVYISKYRDIYWLNRARKWGYPSQKVPCEKIPDLKEELKAQLKAVLAIGHRGAEDKELTQNILEEYGGAEIDR